jgi:hypothetical protein
LALATAHPHRLIAFALALVLMASACRGPGGTPTPIGEAVVDAPAMERLLTKDDIRGAGGDTDGLDRTVENLRALVADVNPSNVEGVDAWLVATFGASDGPALVLTVMEFDSPEPALARLAQAELGPAFGSMPVPVGDRSALSPKSPDIGTAIAFVDGRRFVQLELPVGADGVGLLSADELLGLARLVEERL